MKKIGVFGLGDMGAAITHRLLKKNFEVISTKRGRYMDFIENNSFSVMSNPCEVGASADIIIFCVDTIENLNEIIFSENGLMSSKKLSSFSCVSLKRKTVFKFCTPARSNNFLISS